MIACSLIYKNREGFFWKINKGSRETVFGYNQFIKRFEQLVSFESLRQLPTDKLL